MIQIWDDAGNLLRNLTPSASNNNSGDILYLQPLPNGNLISGGSSNNNSILIWNMINGSVETTLVGHTRFVSSLTLVNATTLASGSADTSIKLWNLTNGKFLKNLNTSSCVLSLKLVNGDGSLLASGHSNGRIKIWNLMMSSLIQIELESPLVNQNITALEMISDMVLASNGLDSNGIVLWNLTK